MAEPAATQPLDPPRVYLVHMTVFVLLVAILVVVILPGLLRAFMANPMLNGVIVATLLFGIIHSFRMVWRLFREVNWVNRFREGDPDDNGRPPGLLAPMAFLLKNRQDAVLSPVTMRSVLDSLASRLDESRDLSRYLVGLLIFLGLLGTFWGLLETVQSIGGAIEGLDVSSTQSATLFDQLKRGLQAPLQGMGLSFSSSLLGLSGSLILGFLDLKAAQAQNRFYIDLEDWLSSITDVAAGAGGDAALQGANAASITPQLLRSEVAALQRAVEKLTYVIEGQRATASPAAAAPRPDGDSIEQLADAVAGLVAQMREEQKIVRQWAQGQQTQQNEIQRLLIRATGPLSRGATRAREDERP
ncbi:flagellar motor protein MotA [Aestuariivirga litoralis]|uniref:Flagellar motor protein MotA n=1 Tax=Aestuariivirga litoralis TaxID=2650924 RepID=A0A2W2CEG0_9HYPH|nr:flagellar motor protein MotA [Aestuariivirga litoralis]PZF78593.1 flagellar motor protein MotA [Aestuariivirga litoralis]